ncbi:hypothetical protein CYMTET_51424 [Cymbomonas tetramitiformis]|uniref:Hexosyltransferase n=1 Tax=Cymbomonas tetramitiformis TaxID=36881 RepID=A0AAE0BMK8_9CHLO|nr:hypothetical protein CYMTET_51424 [Cymbomonas tetramitiformis]
MNLVGKGKQLYADSWFGSVKAVVLLLERGNFLKALVKTNTKFFPLQRLKDLAVAIDIATHNTRAVSLVTDVKLDTEGQPAVARDLFSSPVAPTAGVLALAAVPTSGGTLASPSAPLSQRVFFTGVEGAHAQKCTVPDCMRQCYSKCGRCHSADRAKRVKEAHEQTQRTVPAARSAAEDARLVLIHSLRLHSAAVQNGTAVVVVLASSGVSEDSAELLSAAPWHAVVVRVPSIPFPTPGVGVNNAGDMYTKLHVWRLHEYRKVVYMDSDAYTLDCVDELFLEAGKLSAAPDCCPPLVFNAGVMVLQPSQSDFDELMQEIAVIGQMAESGGGQALGGSRYGLAAVYGDQAPLRAEHALFTTHYACKRLCTLSDFDVDWAASAIF